MLSIEAPNNATKLYRILIRSYLLSKSVLKKYCLRGADMTCVLGEIMTRFYHAKISSIKMAGGLTAQSIGQPATQMMLNLFHYTGVLSKNLTLRLPCLKEITNMAKIVNTPRLTIYLQEGVSGDADSAKVVYSLIKYTVLGDVMKMAEILLQPGASGHSCRQCGPSQDQLH